MAGARTIRVATANVNGVRAAFRRGMGAWLEGRGVDILALQEVRAETGDLADLLGPGWNVLHDAATAKGRAGVAIASRDRASIHRVAIGEDDFDTAGRWLEADFRVDGTVLTVVSAYVHSGQNDSPKQAEKMRMLAAVEARLPGIRAHSELAVVMGDLNIAHRNLDIRNWRGNLKSSGFLPEERAWFDRVLGAEGEPDYNAGAGLGWVDVARRAAGETEGPFTWWTWRGQAFDRDTGWRIDLQLATQPLAERVVAVATDRAPSYAERWSDHTPVVVDYTL